VLGALPEENARAWRRIQGGATDSLEFAARAYTLHNLYCLFENCFLRIAKFFENALDPQTGHQDLVRRMALQRRLQGTVDRFAEAHVRFLEKIRAIAEAV